jgi:hypothetical protein
VRHWPESRCLTSPLACTSLVITNRGSAPANVKGTACICRLQSGLLLVLSTSTINILLNPAHIRNREAAAYTSTCPSLLPHVDADGDCSCIKLLLIHYSTHNSQIMVSKADAQQIRYPKPLKKIKRVGKDDVIEYVRRSESNISLVPVWHAPPRHSRPRRRASSH